MARLKIGNIKGPTGASGKDGVTITGIELKQTTSDGSKVYNILLSDNKKLEFTSPIGPIGNTGPKGEQGIQGVKGIGISSVRYKNLSEDGSFIYTITLTNNQTYDITCPIGPKGDKGDKGEPGETVAISLEFEDIINNWKIATQYIGNTSTSTDFNSITANGTYYSNKYNALYTNGFLGANQQAYQEFKLIVIGENSDGVPVLKSQLVITRDDNIYLRSCTVWQEPWTWSEWKKIARMSDVEEKFKNFCPYAVGDIYITTNSSNPSTKFLGTTWSKIEGRFLLGTSSSQASKLTGGSMNKNISQVNLPNVKLTVDSFSLSTTSHYHLIAYNQNNYGALTANNYISNAAHIGDHQSYEFKGSINIPNVGKTKDAGGGNTSTASPQTSALGSGQALDITPSYYTAHMWLRTS